MKTHTFNGLKYDVMFAKAIEGVCDVPSKVAHEGFQMIILEGNNFRALRSAIEEGLHATGIPTKYLHKSDGTPRINDFVRFLWRLNYRTKETHND